MLELLFQGGFEFEFKQNWWYKYKVQVYAKIVVCVHLILFSHMGVEKNSNLVLCLWYVLFCCTEQLVYTVHR